MSQPPTAPRPSGRLGRRAFVRALALGGGAAMLAACQSPATSGPGAPGSSAAPAPTGPASPSPPELGGPGGAAAPDQAWNALVDAARQEGKVVVKGPPAAEVRTELPKAFRARFGIELEYLGGPTGPFATQLTHERQAGVYSTDVVLSGADSMYTVFYGLGFLEPLRPLLIHPEAADTSAWPDGKLWFMDPEEQYVLRLNNTLQIMGQINTAQVRPEEFTSWNDLLKPQYRGRLAAFDPTVSGSGVGAAAYLYVTLGEDFVRQLYVEQRPAFSRDERQLADWLVRGTYPIAIGNEFATEAILADFRGTGVSVVNLPRPPETPGSVSPSFGLLGVLKDAPHPHAAQVFANWIAGREGMLVWSKASDAVPVRLDVDKSAWSPDVIPDPNVKTYHDSYGWEFVHTQRQPVMARLRDLLR
jgi:iron(III) transport system substrate-binding protein